MAAPPFVHQSTERPSGSANHHDSRLQPFQEYASASGNPSYPTNMPEQDLEVPGQDNTASPTSSPTLPALSSLDQVAGYENVDFEGGSPIPPPFDVQPPPAQHHQQQSDNLQPNFPTISEEDACRALYEEVSEHCCYGTGAVENLVITNIHSSSAFHYQLETFTEGRSTSWAYVPFIGQDIDGPENGQAPSSWDIQTQPDSLFLDHQKHYEVPHTASVKTCSNCDGEGVNRCWRCLGNGIIVCGSCHGNGCHLHVSNHYVQTDDGDCQSHSHTEVVPCLACNCTGKVRCFTCLGCGLLKCKICETHGQLKFYIKLTVTWKSHMSEHVVERTALPDELICTAEGRLAFNEQSQRVIPVTSFPDQAVNDASQQLVQCHSASFPTQRILMQRHWIRIVPVSEVQCDYKSSRFSYWVYGHNNLVFNPDYPQQCCWGCTVL